MSLHQQVFRFTFKVIIVAFWGHPVLFARVGPNATNEKQQKIVIMPWGERGENAYMLASEKINFYFPTFCPNHFTQNMQNMQRQSAHCLLRSSYLQHT